MARTSRSFNALRTVLLGLPILLLCSLMNSPARAQVASDVPQGNWAYNAIKDLAGRGLIYGYPPDGNFLGDRKATRYELGALVQRILHTMDVELAKKADKGDVTTPPPAGIGQDQLDEIKKLVDEFKMELLVMGSDLTKAKSDIEALQSQVGAIQAHQGAQDRDIADLKRAAAQSEKDAADAKKAAAGKADAGYGKVVIGGLLQVWVQTDSHSPADGNFNGQRLRRAEIHISGSVDPHTPNSRSYYSINIDPSKNLALNTTAAGGNITSVSVNQTTNMLQDLFLGYKITKSLALEVGQEKVPMSMEGVRSSGGLYTVERSIVNVLPVNSGRVGDIRDIGAMVRYEHPKLSLQAGIFDDGGNRQNQVDDNNRKEIIYHAQVHAIRHIMLGGYQEISGGVGGPVHSLRNRQGLEASFTLGKHLLEGEYITARDGTPRVRSQGGYVVYLYHISPKWEAVVRGDTWNPNRDLHGAAYTNEYDLTLGANYYINSTHSKLQLNWVRKNVNGPLNAANTGVAAAPFLGITRNQVLASFQQAF